MSRTATRAVWDTITETHLDAPLRLTLLALADLHDAALEGRGRPVRSTGPAQDHATRMRRLIPGAILDDVPLATSPAPSQPTAPAAVRPADLVQRLGVTAPTILNYFRTLERMGYVQTDDRRTFTLAAPITTRFTDRVTG